MTMKYFYFSILIVLSLFVSGCMDELVKKEDMQVMEGSMTRRFNTLNYDLNITKGACNENRAAIEVLQQQVDEISKKLGMMNQTMEQVGGVEGKFNKKLKTMMDEVVKENERLIKEINKTRSTSSSSSSESSGEKSGSALYGKSEKTDFSKGFYHNVEIGENISKIAKKYHVAIQDILKANNLDNPDSLYMGQRLFIPSDKAQSGEDEEKESASKTETSKKQE